MTTTPALEISLARRDVPLPLEPLSEEDIAAVQAEAQTGYGSIRVTDSGAGNSAWLRFYSAWAEATPGTAAVEPRVAAANRKPAVVKPAPVFFTFNFLSLFC